MNTCVHEDVFIEKLVATLSRSPNQINALQQSDAELVRLPGSTAVLALTTDSIVEEIETGLYEDPYLIGWMSVIANVSDLAAVGADPLGILMNQTFLPDSDPGFLSQLQKGVRDACWAAEVHVLGGDTSFSPHVQFGGFAIGLIADGKVITRQGCRPGDLLYSTGPLGAGSAFAFLRLKEGAADGYRPIPRVVEGALIRRFGSCAMDTSDGLLPTLDQLGRVNGVGFEVEMSVDGLVEVTAESLALSNEIERWMMLAGPHGEFELLFTMPVEREEEFLREAEKISWDPISIGRVVSPQGIQLIEEGNARLLDGGAVRNLAVSAGSDVDAYLQGLARIDDSAVSFPRRPEVAS